MCIIQLCWFVLEQNDSLVYSWFNLVMFIINMLRNVHALGEMICSPWLGILSMHNAPLPPSTAVASTASRVSWVVEVLPVSGGDRSGTLSRDGPSTSRSLSASLKRASDLASNAYLLPSIIKFALKSRGLSLIKEQKLQLLQCWSACDMRTHRAQLYRGYREGVRVEFRDSVRKRESETKVFLRKCK